MAYSIIELQLTKTCVNLGLFEGGWHIQFWTGASRSICIAHAVYCIGSRRLLRFIRYVVCVLCFGVINALLVVYEFLTQYTTLQHASSDACRALRGYA